jgi:hypothetical protein
MGEGTRRGEGGAAVSSVLKKLRRNQRPKIELSEHLPAGDLSGALVNVYLTTSYTLNELSDLIAEWGPKLRTAAGGAAYLSIGGYDNDPRELHQIPEVRALCGRVVDSGFIALVGDAADIGDEQHYLIDRRMCWLISRDAILPGPDGRGGRAHISPAMHDEYDRTIEIAQAKVTRILGAEGQVPS